MQIPQNSVASWTGNCFILFEHFKYIKNIVVLLLFYRSIYKHNENIIVIYKAWLRCDTKPEVWGTQWESTMFC